MSRLFTSTLGSQFIRAVEAQARSHGWTMETRVSHSHELQVIMTAPMQLLERIEELPAYVRGLMPPRPVRRRFLIGQHRFVGTKLGVQR